MTVGSLNLSHIWLRISKYQQQINLLIVVLLALYLLAFLADITWRLIPVGQNQSASPSQLNVNTTNSSSADSRVNLARLKSLNLFGDLTAEPSQVQVEEVTEAPETRLSLTLTGVVATNEPSIAAAIIENRGVQNTYGINDEIDGTNAQLLQVFNDRVIIKNGLSRETLMLDGIDYSQNGAVNQREQRPTTNQLISRSLGKNRNDNDDEQDQGIEEEYKTLSPEVAQSTRELRQSPAGFTDFISISPHAPNGELLGYRIAPGKNPSLFTGAGFINGDIVTEINGLDLTDPQQSLEAMNELREAQSLQLTISRGEELLTLYLDFPEGEQAEQDI